MRKLTSCRTLLVSLGAAMLLPLGLVTAPAATADTPPPANARLQALLDELVAAGATGVVARVDDGNNSWALASGVAQLDPRRQLTPAARFRVGSVTKSFVATVALQLVGERRLRLDDTVERWLPGLLPNGAAITLRMLLNHTSGLFNYTDDQTFRDHYDADPTAGLAPRRLVALATAHPPTFEPGAGWSYSNTGYIVVGLMIEAAAGQNIHRLVQDRIIDPLSLTGTTFPAHDPDLSGYHAHGYVPPSLTGAGYRDVTRIAPSLAWTAGAIASTPDDLQRFYAALLGGRLLRPAQLTQLLTTVPVLPTYGYGLGISTQRGPCGTVWGHTGGVPGYATFAFNDRSGRRSAVVMLPTEADDAIGSLLQLTVDTAICQMFGRVPPTTARAGYPATLRDTAWR
jgi:D-alanyl-D-alanine carboxypeptidase